MPYAADDRVSKGPIDGGVPISEEKYNEARAHVLADEDNMVKVHGGNMILTTKPAKIDGHEEPVWQNGGWYHAPIEEEPKTIQELADDKHREIDTARADAFKAGTAYTFPDGTADHIQIRPEDKSNLLAIAMEARELKAADETGQVIEFRSAANKTYWLTPDQAITMTNAALDGVKAIYKKSWDLKDEVNASLDAGDREGIEAISW
ncbi:DUF4376 domain-containing protein [Marinobacter oulmenensis]|uniref:DUF4376 domain-containing protein n=1 Tax=Marinobacter oulmenensis TaxID=643747 RepID=A0A840U428_9GAMM|nr:DUF4376 domain-containing protein [Marinobacter oulmenensis]MBB5320464.1 hypothetical protein [Marinobacter oulmenensis]